MQNLKIRKATKEDIELLINLRIDYLTSDGMIPSPEDAQKNIEILRDYFSRHIDGGDFIAELAEVDGKIAAVAFIVIYERPINPSYMASGITAVIYNVLTYPKYRRQGIATKLLSLLIEEAKKLKVDFIELSASAMGKPVYEKLGFKEKTQSKFTEMKLNL